MIREELNSGYTVLNLMVHRYRKVYIAFPLYLLFLAFMSHLPKSWSPDPLLGLLMVPFGLGLLWTVFGFVNADADIASTDSAYSPWILRMPLKTTSLALWPMLAATAWAVVSWLLLTFLCLRNRVDSVAMVWPALAVAALALIFQAILWPPMRVGGFRMVLAIILPTCVALFGTIAAGNQWSAEHICEVYGVVCVLSSAFAYAGLVRARTTPTLSALNREHAKAQSELRHTRHAKSAFQSPEAAQFWLEWRMQGRLLPLLTIFVLMLASAGLFFERSDIDRVTTMMTFHKYNSTLVGTGFAMNLYLKTYFPLLPYVPLVLATIIGLGARPASMRSADGSYHVYFATRPLSPAQMYWAKMKAVAAGSATACVATYLVMFIWAILPINRADPDPGRMKIGQVAPSDQSASYLSNIIGSASAHGALTLDFCILLAMAIILALWTWRNQAVGACMDYVVSEKLARAYPLVVVVISSSVITLWQSSSFLYRVPTGLWIVSGILSLWIAAKASVALFGLLKLRRLRPGESDKALKTIATWLVTGSVAAITLGVIEHCLGESNFYLCLVHPVPELLGFVLVPVARPIIARIALETGRHR